MFWRCSKGKDDVLIPRGTLFIVFHSHFNFILLLVVAIAVVLPSYSLSSLFFPNMFEIRSLAISPCLIYMQSFHCINRTVYCILPNGQRGLFPDKLYRHCVFPGIIPRKGRVHSRTQSHFIRYRGYLVLIAFI